MQTDLVFDLGAHRGEDTDFYLKKGFRVVSIEADPELADALNVRFATAVAQGRLTVVNKALSDAPGHVTLYKNTQKAIWNTISKDFDERNRIIGTDSVAVQVEATTMAELLSTYGVPYFVKIDIEGYDRVALEGLGSTPDRPRHVSIESEKDSFRELRRDFERLTALGYDRFKVVAQLGVQHQRAPRPPREGADVEHAFEHGSSGLFGEEAPGRWMTADEAIEAYRPIFLRYHLTGDDPLIRNKWLRRLLKRTGFRAGWHDLHARLGERAG